MTEAQVEAALEAGASGATFCFEPGTYRMSLTPKKGQRLIAEPGAVLKGTKVVEDWKMVAGKWVASGQTFSPTIIPGPPYAVGDRECEAVPLNCHYVDLFRDGQRVKRVGTNDVGPGEWNFDYGADKVYYGSDPRGATMELTNKKVGIDTGGDNLIDGFGVWGFANLGIVTQAGDVVRNADVAWNHGTGIRLGGNPASIIGGHTHHNGQFGAFCAGANKTIDGLEFSYNNNLHFANSNGGYWGAGAIKCVQTTNLIVRNVYSHDNYSDGFWTDINNVGVLYENNRMVRNERFGIFHEISCSMEVRNSDLQDNASHGLYIHSSIDGDVHHNSFGGNGGAGVAIKDNLTRRAECADAAGPCNNSVHDNQLELDAILGCVAPRNSCWNNTASLTTEQTTEPTTEQTTEQTTEPTTEQTTKEQEPASSRVPTTTSSRRITHKDLSKGAAASVRVSPPKGLGHKRPILTVPSGSRSLQLSAATGKGPA